MKLHLQSIQIKWVILEELCPQEKGQSLILPGSKRSIHVVQPNLRLQEQMMSFHGWYWWIIPLMCKDTTHVPSFIETIKPHNSLKWAEKSPLVNAKDTSILDFLIKDQVDQALLDINFCLTDNVRADSIMNCRENNFVSYMQLLRIALKSCLKIIGICPWSQASHLTHRQRSVLDIVDLWLACQMLLQARCHVYLNLHGWYISQHQKLAGITNNIFWTIWICLCMLAYYSLIIWGEILLYHPHS